MALPDTHVTSKHRASPLLIAATCSAQTRSSPISDALCAVVHDGEVRRPTVRTRCTSLSPCLSQPVLTARSLLAAPPSWRPRGPPSRARRWRGPAGASCTEIARAWARPQLMGALRAACRVAHRAAAPADPESSGTANRRLRQAVSPLLWQPRHGHHQRREGPLQQEAELPGG